MDWDLVAKWAPFVISALVIPAARWGVKAGLVPRAEFDRFVEAHRLAHAQLEDRLDAGDVRFERLEVTLKHMPTKEDVEELRRDVSDLSGNVRALTATVEAMGRTSLTISEQLQMLVQHHIKGAAK